MNRAELEQKKKLGFDETVINNQLSIMLLLLRTTEHFNNEAKDYLKEFGMCVFDMKKDLNFIESKIDTLAKKIMPAFKDNPDNKINFFEDFDNFLQTVEKFMK